MTLTEMEEAEMDLARTKSQTKSRSKILANVPPPAPKIDAETRPKPNKGPEKRAPKKTRIDVDPTPAFHRRQLALPGHLPVFHADCHVEVQDAGKTWWPATVVEMKGGRILCHYEGWDARFDEWLDCESPRVRLSTGTESGDRQSMGFMDDVQLVGRSVRQQTARRPRKLDGLKQMSTSKARKRRKSGEAEHSPTILSSSSLPTPAESPERINKDDTPQPDIPFDFASFNDRSAANRRAREEYIQRRALAAADTPESIKARFTRGSRVEVCCGGGVWYTGMVRKARGWQILVHYDDWDDSWDEWIDINSSKLRLIQEAEELQESTESESQSEVEESDDERWKIFCNQCTKRIRQRRYFCTNCEDPSEGFDYNSFDLCLPCFQYDFPLDHPHPISSFAAEAIIDGDDPSLTRAFTKGELVSSFVPDEIDDSVVAVSTAYTEHYPTSKSGQQTNAGDGAQQQRALPVMPKCAFCRTEHHHLKFIGPSPFRNTKSVMKRKALLYDSNKTKWDKKSPIFWAHVACARYSPEVYLNAETGQWFNVLKALRRSRQMKCAQCRGKGATIGCFDYRCSRSYHVACTNKPLSHFEEGIIFWCPRHEALLNKIEDYQEAFHCDSCSCALGASGPEEQWYTCDECSQSHFASFDLCVTCYTEKRPSMHEHSLDRFVLDCMSHRQSKREAERELARELIAANAPRKSLQPRKRRPMENSSRRRCSYCWTESTPQWRRGYNGMPMCQDCFELASSAWSRSDKDMCDPPKDLGGGRAPMEVMEALPAAAESEYTAAEHDMSAPVLNPTSMEEVYKTDISAYSHEYYLTRGVVEKAGMDGTEIMAADSKERALLSSYAPADDQLYTLGFDTSFYDIPGRAPRWASHSGGDYHGTWLPQIVRLSLTRYTKEGDRVLSNFSGRGTDAIECYLLKRPCCAVDINPASVALSQRNVAFSAPPEIGLSAAYRPIVVNADSRDLVGSLFKSETYDHVLSHPPYKDCISYSAHIDGDLSHFPEMGEFQEEMAKVVAESWRLLKPGRRCTLGIGDNRRECFYQPVSFQTIRTYMDNGFQLEELIVKRQRYCQMAPLGTFLCTQYNFLMFTHEFVAILRKVGKDDAGFAFLQNKRSGILSPIAKTSKCRQVPHSPIDRASVVMGTTWAFHVTKKHSLARLAMSKLVERFGKDGGYWEEVSFSKFRNEVIDMAEYDSLCAERDPPVDDDEEDGEGEDKSVWSVYEKRRQELVLRNRKELMARGLVSELSPEGEDDWKHLRTLLSVPELGPSERLKVKPCLIFVPHICVPSTAILPSSWIEEYMEMLVECATEAADRLAEGGFLVVGVKDVRVKINVPEVTSTKGVDEEQPNCGRTGGDDGRRSPESVSTAPDRVVDNPNMEVAPEDDASLGTENLPTTVEPTPDDAASVAVGIPASIVEAAPEVDAPVSVEDNEDPISSIGPTRYIPLGLLVNEKLTAHLESPSMIKNDIGLRLKDFVVAVPDGYARDAKALEVDEVKERIAEDVAEWDEEMKREDGGEEGVRRILPIVQAFYLIYIKTVLK
ncbi:uncharacterized protein EV422DRAFT_563174 [Fimicolochytrium jonesii]|uniref:uncharacterized protein n=1 Tax=Fimicolochytrium jonesii TaxID=1396493 RepID=UPI0022FE6BE5|nr:uncharacterized protein EV422DRAFT_563174 [Fimicolochytrium jonesii]KAI8827096.1 hypothetical protein EV422DRAFT_563174 [Fimicolochytrium jonesii]